jgi:hypothetical protein
MTNASDAAAFAREFPHGVRAEPAASRRSLVAWLRSLLRRTPAAAPAPVAKAAPSDVPPMWGLPREAAAPPKDAEASVTPRVR